MATQEVKEIVRKHQKKIASVLKKYLDNKKLLDIGCGNGVNALFLKSKFNPEIALLDYQDLRIEEAKKFPFFKASIDNMPFIDKSFDVSFTQYVLHHLAPFVSISKAFREIKRVTKGPIILVEEICTEKTNKKKAREYDLAMNKKLHPSVTMKIHRYYSDEDLKKEFRKVGLSVVEEKIFEDGCKEDGFLQRKIYVLSWKK